MAILAPARAPVTEQEDPLDYLNNMYEDVVSPYMRDRFGMTEDNMTREEIVREAEKHMRRFTAGNSVRTLNELNYLNSVEDKNLALNMYEAWDAAPSAYGSGGGRRATYDYAMSLLADPVNAVSLGVGRGAATLAGRGAKEIAVEAARRAAQEAAAAASRRGVKGQALEQVRREAFARSQRQILRETGSQVRERSVRPIVNEARGRVGDVARREQIADITAVTGAEMAAAGLVDRAYQQTQIVSGAQDEYDWTQTMFSMSLGAAGGGLALGLTGTKLFNNSIDPMALVSTEMERSSRIMQARDLRSMREAAREASPEKIREALREPEALNKVRVDIDKLRSDVTSFADSVRSGKLAEEMGTDPDLSTSAQEAIVMRMIMLGNPEKGTKGIMGILEGAGVPAYRPRSADDNVTNYVADAIDALPGNLKASVMSLVNRTVRAVNPDAEKITAKTFRNYTAKELSVAGQKLNVMSQMSRVGQKLNKSADEVTPQEFLENLAPEKLPKDHESLPEYLQRHYIGALVTHPATTAVNVIGSATASSLQGLTDITKGLIYGGVGVASRVFDKGANLSKARGSFGAAKARLMNMLDPQTGYEEFKDYITVRPELQKELFSYISGGVQTSKALKGMGVDLAEEPELDTIEKGMRIFQTAYGVRLQDFYFKSQEFMNALDKQIRDKYGMSYREFMRQDDVFDLMTNPARNGEYLQVEARATQQTLKNIFAQPYAHLKESEGTVAKGLGRVAEIVEEARSIPIIGALVPFGQFFNNTVGFMMDYSGLSLVGHTAYKFRGRKLGRTGADPMEMLARTAVGWGVVNYMIDYEMDNLEEGLAWYEDRVGGTVIDRQLDFPYTPFKAMSRVYAHMRRDGEVPQELTADIMRTLGPESITRGLGDLGEYLKEIAVRAVQGDATVLEFFKEGATASASTYASGATRFLDPFNQAVALYRGEDYVGVDRQQGAKYLNNALRYVDQIYFPLTQVERNQSLTDRQVRPQTAKLLGFRESLPATDIQKMFNDVGRPDWIDGIRFESQEAENIFRGAFFPYAEMMAYQIYNGTEWENLTIPQKEEILDNVLSRARQQTRERLLSSVSTDDAKTGLIYQITSKNLRSAEMQELLQMFDVEAEDIWKLSVPQLRLLLSYTEGDRDRDTALQRSVGLR